MNTRIFSFLAACALAVLPHAAAAQPGSGFDLKLFAQGFVSPVALIPLPGSGGTLLVADQAGTVQTLTRQGKLGAKPFLDLRSRLVKLNSGFDERGLLGLALHPKFSSNKKVYAVYSVPLRAGAPTGWDSTLRLAEFTAAPNGRTADPASEKVLLEIDKPYFNHNGGSIAFGPDGFLYIAVGDGGNANDRDEPNQPKGRPPEGNGQNLQTHLGKILRIDVDRGHPYAIPKDNPFVGQPSIRPEIYAYGLRNPWRISFDRGGTHQLFAADVGQEGFEEVDIVVNGGNYGWNIREGTHCFDPANPAQPPANCPKVGARGEPLIDPVMEYKNFKNHQGDPAAQGISITGGYIYRGRVLPGWDGKYIFADWSAAWAKPLGVLFAGTKGQDGQWSWATLAPATASTEFYITALGQDADGELYVLTNNSNSVTGLTGKIYQIVPHHP